MTDIRDALQTALGSAYTIERELGGGGMSRVFVAMDTTLGRRVVVKVLSPDLAAAVYVDRFMREIMVVATLQHPHIVGVLSAADVDGMPFFIMPYVEGESLRAHLAAHSPMPVREAVTILRDVARALAYAHERGVVHRDIKPDNVLLASGSATVTDFGVAKAVLSSQRAQQITPTSTVLTQIGTTVGTPAYMAPEQIAADPTVDHRADIYAFGIMAYEMLAGGPPFSALTPQGILAAHLSQPPRPLGAAREGLPPQLTNLIMACLEKDREGRPQTARAIVNALDEPTLISGAAMPTLSLPRQRLRRRLTRIGLPIATVIAVLALGLAQRHRSAATAASAALGSADSARAHAVLVMPFANLSTDSGDAYLAEGITNELVSSLIRVPGLHVASHITSNNSNDHFPSEQELGTTFKVGFVLEGTVQRERTRLRITARLVNTKDGFTAWADVFDRTMRDAFAVQQDISGSIISALGSHLGTAAPSSAYAARGTTSDSAYDLFLRGSWLTSRRGAESLQEALRYLSEAVKRDTGFARAYAATAHAYSLVPLYGGASADSAAAKGLAAANHAVALDSTLASAFSARAALYNATFRWDDAERDYRRALQLDPGDASTHQGFGENLLVRGRVTEAVAELKRAATLDSTSAVTLGSYALALSIAGDQSTALSTARHALALDSTIFVTRLMLGSVFIFGGHPDSALSPLEAANGLSRNRSSVLSMLGYAYARVGDQRKARSLYDGQLRSRDPDAPLAAAHIALGLGDTTEALKQLGAAARQHAPQFGAESLAEPIFDSIRASPQFLGALRALGLPDALAHARS